MEILAIILAFEFPYIEGTFILAAITAVYATGHWIHTSADRRARQKEDKRIKDLEDNPFERLQCWIKKIEGKNRGPTWLGEIPNAEIDRKGPDYNPDTAKLILSQNQYFIYIQAFTRMGVTIHKANLRFPGHEPRPQVMNLKNPTVPPEAQRQSSPDTQGGRDLTYTPPIKISEGRAINHIAQIGIESEYTGEIGLRLEVEETGRPYYLAIPCTTQPPSQTALNAAPARPWWKLW